MKTETMIAVRDVEASSRFYQQLLGAKSAHGGNEYDMIVKGDELLLQLHDWDPDEHSGMLTEGIPLGNGVLIMFRCPDFDDVVERARELDLKFLEEPMVNPLAHHRECIVEDPDGYSIGLISERGDLG